MKIVFSRILSKREGVKDATLIPKQVSDYLKNSQFTPELWGPQVDEGTEEENRLKHQEKNESKKSCAVFCTNKATSRFTEATFCSNESKDAGKESNLSKRC